MADDQPPPIPPQDPASPSAPVPSTKPSFMPHYESDPPTSDRPGLPTWMWVVIIVLLTIILVPVLLIGALYLYCVISNDSFSVGP